MNRIIFILGFILFLFWSCDNNDIINVELSDFTSDFDTVWVNFDKTYPLFSFKKIDWDKVRTEHRDKFKDITEYQRNNYLASALSVLKDGHVFINTSSNNLIQTYINNKIIRNYNEEYLDKFKTSISWNKVNDFWGWGKYENIGYIVIKSFNSSNLDSLQFDSVMDSLINTKGIILDLRVNYGGNLNLCSAIWGRFTDKNIEVGTQLYRNGPNHDDYASEIPVFAKPRGGWQYTNKVVMLIGRLCGSAGEIFAETFSHINNAILIGDTPAGIVTATITKELLDGTEYSLPVVAYMDVYGEPLEWNGVSPEIYFNHEELTNITDKDVLINKAIELINY
jgi:peptidase S41-like protein